MLHKKLENYSIYLTNLKKSKVYINYLNPLFNYLDKHNLQFETLSKEQLAQYFADKEFKIQSINIVINSCRGYCKFLKIEKHAII